MPTHFPPGELAHSGTRPRMASGMLTNMPSTAPSPPGSWAKNTSAGPLSPSSRRVAASSDVPAYLTCTLMPVRVLNCSIIGPTRLSLLPTYRVRSPGRFSTSTSTARAVGVGPVVGVGSALLQAASPREISNRSPTAILNDSTPLTRANFLPSTFLYLRSLHSKRVSTLFICVVTRYYLVSVYSLYY